MDYVQEIKEEDFNPNSTHRGARSDTQWLEKNFFALPHKEVVDSEMITIEHLNVRNLLTRALNS